MENPIYMNVTQYFIPLFLVAVAVPDGFTQTVSPATPKGFEIRKNGSSAGTGGSVGLVSPPKKAKTQVITYTALSKVRQWHNSDGKAMMARLLAFPSRAEENKTKGKSPQFTVIHEQKVRFLMIPNNKAITYPLEKLSVQDQEFIEKIAHAAAQAAKSPQEAKADSSSKK